MSKFEKLIYIAISLYAVGSLFVMARLIDHLKQKPPVNTIEVHYIK